MNNNALLQEAAEKYADKTSERSTEQWMQSLNYFKDVIQSEAAQQYYRQQQVSPVWVKELATHLNNMGQLVRGFQPDAIEGEYWSEWDEETLQANSKWEIFLDNIPNESKVLSDEDKPKVVCFCGSTRFAEWFMIKRWELEKQGIITFGINILPDNYFAEGNAHGAEQEGVKEVLDELHKRKIDLSDEVFVLNVGGYIGESTRNEINYAISKNKPIKYLE